MRNQKIFVTLIILCGFLCLFYYHGRSTKTSGFVSANVNTQFHIDYPNSRIQTNSKDKMMRVPEPELDKCRQMCEDTDWCHFWEHNPTTDNCALYRSISQGSNYEASIVPYQGSYVGVFERKMTK